MKNGILRGIAGYILNGVLITVPIAIVFYIIYKILVWLSTPLLNVLYTKEELALTGTEISPLSIFLLLVFLFLMGYLGTKLISEPIKRSLERWLEKVPFYKSLKDLIDAFVGSKKRFNKPVLVKINSQQELEMIGFVTDEDLTELADEIDGKVAVYFPMSYSFSGHLVVVPRKNVSIIDRNSVEIMKYIVSGGIVEIEKPEDDAK